MLKHLLSIVTFVVVTFSVQGLNHFVFNKAHYENIDFARSEPIMVLGFITMIVQGGILTFAMTKVTQFEIKIRHGVLVSLTFGFFLAVYIILSEPAKYTAPSLSSWMITEAIASSTQFTIFGLLLGFIHSKLQ